MHAPYRRPVTVRLALIRHRCAATGLGAGLRPADDAAEQVVADGNDVEQYLARYACEPAFEPVDHERVAGLRAS